MDSYHRPSAEQIASAIVLLNERGKDARKVMQLHDMIQIYNTQLKTIAYIDAHFGLQCNEMDDMQNYVMSDDKEFGIPFVQQPVKGGQPIVGFYSNGTTSSNCRRICACAYIKFGKLKISICPMGPTSC